MKRNLQIGWIAEINNWQPISNDLLMSERIWKRDYRSGVWLKIYLGLFPDSRQIQHPEKTAFGYAYENLFMQD